MINYSIISGKLDPTEAFHDYAIKKLNKINLLLKDAQTDAKLSLSKENKEYKLDTTFIVHNIRKGLPEKTYKTSVTHPDAYAAIDLSEEKLKRQIRKTLTSINRDDRRLKNLRKVL